MYTATLKDPSSCYIILNRKKNYLSYVEILHNNQSHFDILCMMPVFSQHPWKKIAGLISFKNADHFFFIKRGGGWVSWQSFLKGSMTNAKLIKILNNNLSDDISLNIFDSTKQVKNLYYNFTSHNLYHHRHMSHISRCKLRCDTA